MKGFEEEIPFTVGDKSCALLLNTVLRGNGFIAALLLPDGSVKKIPRVFFNSREEAMEGAKEFAWRILAP